jgi:spore germination protein
MEGSANKTQGYITVSQFALIIFSSIVGIGILSLPNGVVKAAHQDGWISTLIGGIYPLYVVIIARYISKRFPDHSILVLSKMYFGRYLGNAFNLIFASYFIFIASMIASYYANITRAYIMGFLTPFKIIAVLLMVTIYASSRDLKVIGRISEIAFFITIILLLSPVAALREFEFTNIKPVFGSGFISIIEGSVKSAFSYSGAEIILIIYPFLKDKKKMLTSSLISVSMCIILYVWCVFITTYYLGPDIVNKSYWSFLLVTGSITITVINNYRYIFIFLWSLIAFKGISIYGYASIFIIKDFAKKIEKKHLTILMYPLLLFLALKYGNEISRQNISEKMTLAYVVFNLLYITVIATFVFLKGGAKS